MQGFFDCPECGQSIDGERLLGVTEHVAICPQCGADITVRQSDRNRSITDFGWNLLRQDQADRKAAKKPFTISVHDPDRNGLRRIIVRGELYGTILLSGVTVAATWQTLTKFLAGDMRHVGLFATVNVVLLMFWIARLINRTTFTVEGQMLRVTFGPLTFFRNDLEVSVADIRSIFVERGFSKRGTSDATYPTWSLKMATSNGDVHSLLRLLPKAHNFFVEKTLKRMLVAESTECD